MRSSTQENWGLICNGGSRSQREAIAWLEMKNPTGKGKSWPILLIDQEQKQTHTLRGSQWGALFLNKPARAPGSCALRVPTCPAAQAST